MTPIQKDNEGWRHQALVDAQNDFDEAHKRLRIALEKEETTRKELEKKVEELIEKLRAEVKSEYMRKDVFSKAFDPVQRGFYAVIGLVLTTVIIGILTLVIKSKQ